MGKYDISDDDVHQIFTVHDSVYEAMCRIMHKEVEWDANWIVEIAEFMAEQAVEHFGVGIYEVYPYHEDEN